MAWTLDDNDLGHIESENPPVSSDLDLISFPLSTSKESFCMDYGGVKRIITVKGRYYATTIEGLANWIATMDALQNGGQSTVIYHSDLWDASTVGDYQDGKFNVKVQRFDPLYVNTQTLSVTYTLTLYESEAD